MALYYFNNHPHAKGRNGQKINTCTHYEYICRQGKYANVEIIKQDLVFTRSGNMPEWAKNVKDFWKTAEKNRQKNGRAYREIRMGLQEELSLNENIALVEEFLKESGISKNHAFTYAIHDPIATFDEDHHNIYCQIMFCEKIIEKDRPLDRDRYFKHYYATRNGIPCAGYRVSRYYQSRQGTIEMRKMWADIVNRKFRELGIDKEISEKTLAMQRKELLEKGKTKEAENLKRDRAPHLGPKYSRQGRIKRIKKRIKEIEYQLNQNECQDEINKRINNDDVVERKITKFAMDKVIRRIIKEQEKKN